MIFSSSAPNALRDLCTDVSWGERLARGNDLL